MNKFAELRAEYIKADKEDVDDFRDQFSWRGPSIEDRLAFCDFRLMKAAKFLLRTLELLGDESASPKSAEGG